MLLVTGCGPGSMRHTSPSFSPVAHTDPAPTAMPSRTFAPTGIVWPTRLVRGSIRVTAERSASTNQTPASPAAIVLARASIVATLLPVLGSMREIVWSGLIAQTAPAPTAMPGKPTLGHELPLAVSGSLTVRVIRSERRSTRETLTVPLLSGPPPFPTQSAPAPAAMSLGTPPISNRLTTFLVFGSIREMVLSSVFSTQTAPSPTATLLGAVRVSVNDARRPVPEPIAATPLPSTLTWSPPPPAVSATIPAAAAAHASSSPPSPISKAERRGARGRGGRRTDAPSCGSCLRIACSSSCSARPGSSPSSATSVSRASRYTASDSA